MCMQAWKHNVAEQPQYRSKEIHVSAQILDMHHING